MPALGALPSRFRRARVLVVGCGDVGLRTAAPLARRVRVLALTSSPERIPLLRAAGLTPLWGQLDRPETLSRLAGLAPRVLHLAPPPAAAADFAQGPVESPDRRRVAHTDPRTVALLRALCRRGHRLHALVYGSTSGVYGDCAGAWVDETRAPAPATARAHRRWHAEQQVRDWSRRGRQPAVVLRIPGIYAPDREGGTPRGRLLKGLPVLVPQDDVYTNHIHADDLARACGLALWRGARYRTVNVADDTELKMGDYVDWAADLYGLPRPVRVTREAAKGAVSPMVLSFMGESRRLVNVRMKTELGLVLRYPTIEQGLRSTPR